MAVDRDLAAPPASPQEGVAYIVGPSPSAGWAGHADDLAVRVDGVWTFLAPQIGWGVWLLDENRPVHWTGSAWKPLLEAIETVTDLAGVGIGTAPDATNRLAVRAPAALFAGESAASGGSGDMRVTVEKETVADTASLLFQTDWSGRAEIGLTGDDDLRIKVSPDGATWIEALRIVAATGRLVPGPGGLAGGGRLVATTAFIASGTWTRPAGVRYALVFAVGAGGGGGGVSGGASAAAAGGGGGAGGLAISFLDVSELASETVTIGAGGSGGANTGGNGNSGGNTSFGTAVVAVGGAGGTGMVAGTTPAAVASSLGGGITSGDLGFTGASGDAGLRIDANVVVSGCGGGSFFGGGGRSSVSTSNGASGAARGSGGGGGATSASTTGRAGGNGAAGFLWIWEFE